MKAGKHIHVLSAGTLALLCGCTDGPEVSTDFQVRDSVGVRVVEHRVLPSRLAFHLEEVYTHGPSAGDHQFINAWSGTLLSNGVAAVGDARAQEVVAIDPSGSKVDTLGTAGEGPGEFGRVISVTALRGDTIVVEDDGNLRFTFIHDNQYVRSQSTAAFSSAWSSGGVGVLDRRLISRPTQYRLYIDEAWNRLPITAHDLDSDRWDTLTVYDVAPRLEQGRMPDPFRPWGYVGLGQEGVLIGRGDRAEIRVHDPESGLLTGIVRWPPRHARLTPGEWARYEVPRRDGSQERQAELAELRIAVVEPLPEILDVKGDDLGRLWVGRFDVSGVPSEWEVFSPNGESLGQIRLPERTTILEIRGDLMLTVQRDDLDVQAVTLYRLLPRE